MNQPVNQNKAGTYIKCKKCDTLIHSDTKKKMTPCKCGAIEVDGCDEYVRVVGDKDKYIEIQK